MIIPAAIGQYYLPNDAFTPNRMYGIGAPGQINHEGNNAFMSSVN